MLCARYKLAIREGHQVIQHGPYKHLRHPGYTWAMVAHAFTIVCFRSVWSIVLFVIPLIFLLKRIPEVGV